MAISVLRRYTPPTCTLEIMAKNSPLSRWTDRPVLKDVRFRLAIDGPHLSSDQHVRVQGDRHQLEMLCDVVETYVQQMLSQSACQFSAHLFQCLPTIAPDAELSPSSQHRSAPLPPKQQDMGRSLVPPDIMLEQSNHNSSMPNANAINQTGGMGIIIPSGLALLPKGQLSHTLWFGTLATADSGASVNLSTIELFDLANALEQYKTDQLAVPDLSRKGWLQTTPAWMRAAAVVVFAVGTTTVVTKMGQQSDNLPATSEAPVVEEVEPLPTEQEGEDFAAQVPSSREEAGIPRRFQVKPVEPRPEPNERRGDRSSSRPSSNERTNAESTPAAPPNESAPDPSNSASSDSSASRQSREIPPELANLPPVQSQGDDASAPRLQASEEEEAVDQPSAERSFEGDAPASLTAPDSRADTSPLDYIAEQSPTSPAPLAALPQVNEIRAYFQDTWQPPEDLERTVEYRLILNSNGTLAQVTPLGHTARIYANRTGMPAIGEAFVSPLETSNMPQIRLVLQPNGQVRAFLESWN